MLLNFLFFKCPPKRLLLNRENSSKWGFSASVGFGSAGAAAHIGEAIAEASGIDIETGPGSGIA